MYYEEGIILVTTETWIIQLKQFFFLLFVKEGNPFKPFWDELEVDFDEKIVYHLGTHAQDPYERDKWQLEYVSS